MRAVGCLVALLVGSAAHAGSGPWTVARGGNSLFVGLEAQRLSKLAIVGEDGRDVIDVDQGLSTFGAKGIVTYGITNRVEIEGTLPWYQVTANRDDGPLCSALGFNPCDRTRSIGIIETRLKWQLADELSGAPISVAIGGQLRVGAFTHAERARITNVGEGTTDLGGFVSVGRSGSLGGKGGYWSAFADAGGLYRAPNTRDFPDGNGVRAVPGAELWAVSDVFFAPTPAFAVGPEVVVAWRPVGLDFFEADLTDIDRFASLKVMSTRVGAKVILRDERNVAYVLSFLRTVAARNNPTDTWLVQGGVNINGLFDRKGG